MQCLFSLTTGSSLKYLCINTQQIYIFISAVTGSLLQSYQSIPVVLWCLFWDPGTLAGVGPFPLPEKKGRFWLCGGYFNQPYKWIGLWWAVLLIPLWFCFFFPAWIHVSGLLISLMDKTEGMPLSYFVCSFCWSNVALLGTFTPTF